MDPDSLQLEQHHNRFHIGHTFMAIGVFVALLLSLLLSAIPTGRVRAFGTADVAVLSNQSRSANGISNLILNSKLSAAAQAKANHMVSNNYFEHTAPDGTTGWYFIGFQGYSYTMAGENLAATNESASAVVDGWMNSPGHRANLLNASFSEVGYGIAYQGSFQGYQDVYYVVALYAQPAESTAAPNTPESDSPQSTASKGSNVSTPTQSAPSGQISEKSPTSPVANGQTESEPLSDSDIPVVGLVGTTSGVSTSLAKQSFSITKSMSLAVAGLSVILILVGLWIEIVHFFRHGSGIHTMRHSH